MKNVKLFLPIIILLSYFAIKPLLLSGFFPMHDDTQVQRVYEMQRSLSDGLFPVRWVPDLGYGYGYPIFNFYAPLAYYVGGFIALLGFDALVATKIMISIAMIFSGVSMFILAREFWGEVGGVIASVLYVYAPYHALDLYVRGDVAELYAYALIPLVFFGLWRAFLKKDWKYVVIGSLAYAGVVVSHNLTALMISPFVLIVSLIYFFFSKKNYFPLLIVFLGIVTSAFYWLPVLFEMKYTNVLSLIGGGSHYADHFVCLPQLWDSPWGFGGSAPGCVDGLSFKIGKIHVLLSVLFPVLLVFFRKLSKRIFFTILFAYIFLLISVFMTLAFSKGIWDILPFMPFFQFPWRFLILTAFFASFVGGGAFWLMQEEALKKRNALPLFLILSGVFVGVIIFSYQEMFVPQEFRNKNSGDYTSREYLTWKTSKISDEYMPKGFKKPSDEKSVPASRIELERGSYKIVEDRTGSLKVDVAMPVDGRALIRIAYFPFWEIKLDGKRTHSYTRDNGIEVIVPKGKHIIEATLGETPLERIADFVSMAGVIGLFAGIIIRRKSRT